MHEDSLCTGDDVGDGSMSNVNLISIQVRSVVIIVLQDSSIHIVHEW